MGLPLANLQLAAPQTPEVVLLPLTPAWVEAVVAVEQTAYTHPWSRRHFHDTLAAGHHARLLVARAASEPPEGGGCAPGDELIGYYVAMKGVDEVHLLNITVAPAHQRRGWGRLLLDAFALWARGEAAQCAWLEVRASNTRAQAVYEAHGYRRMGLRRGYYPAARGEREDAVVMCLPLATPSPEPGA
ncbi:MAG: ribosomal protein S18-alanine N-acetyltransferase [Pseudomonadota bacterium]